MTPERLAQWAELLKAFQFVCLFTALAFAPEMPSQEISPISLKQIQSREKFFLILLMFVSALALKLRGIVEIVMCLNIFFWVRELTKDENSALVTFLTS